MRCALLAALLGLLVACGGPAAPERPLLALDGRTMGTSWSLRVAAPPETLREAELQNAVEARLARINGLMSTYDPDSTLSRFNAARGSAWFPVDAELVFVIDAAQELSRLSDGAFDITVAPLVNLWGFGPGATVGAQELPDAAAIGAARGQIGWQRLETRAEPPALRKDGDLQVDLSAIAKGYGVDAMAELLEARGVTDYLVEIGGELRARGRNGRDQPWRVGVEVPDPARRGVAREAIGLEAGAVATSGDYRNFFTVDGVRYSHTIDPATGRPVEHAAASVTVLHPSAMWADGWATTLNVLGAERGLALAAERQLPVLFILYAEDGLEERSSPEFEAYRSRSAP
ncbi:MAG TPA: FAD:protein FMN transferase [Pseudomonadales bacterium]|nr:FAD:protein FMN transferase [Pseudomonadales bacterium]